MRKRKNMAFNRLNITIPKETKKKLERIAKKEQRSLSNMITHLIEDYKES